MTEKPTNPPAAPAVPPTVRVPGTVEPPSGVYVAAEHNPAHQGRRGRIVPPKASPGSEDEQ